MSQNVSSEGPATAVVGLLLLALSVTFSAYDLLLSLEPHFNSSEFGLLIGEKECWGKGYGTETTRLMLDYGFTCLNLHNIMLRAYSFNERGLRAYRRAGFQEIGRRREAIRLAGRVHDEVLMDCLATEFESPLLLQLLV